MKAHEFQSLLDGASSDFRNRNRPQAGPVLPATKPKKQAGSLDLHREGEAPRSGCPLVRFTLCRVSLLDVDAKWGSVKDLLDGLQYSCLVCGDKEGQIRLEVIQQKVHHFAEERTEIEIHY